MSNGNRNHRYQNKKKPARSDSNHSFFDKYPNPTSSRYWIPKLYKDHVPTVIHYYINGIPFNKAVDRVAKANPQLNRNKLLEHTLKYIANDN